MNATSETLTVRPLADGTFALMNVDREVGRYTTASGAQGAARREFGAEATLERPAPQTAAQRLVLRHVTDEPSSAAVIRTRAGYSSSPTSLRNVRVVLMQLVGLGLVVATKESPSGVRYRLA